jgi:hypothetical protein
MDRGNFDAIDGSANYTAAVTWLLAGQGLGPDVKFDPIEAGNVPECMLTLARGDVDPEPGRAKVIPRWQHSCSRTSADSRSVRFPR